MGIPRLSPPARRAALLLPLIVAASACATTGAGRTLGAVDAPRAASERGPGVRIWTAEDFGSSSRVRPSFRLEEDAYVVVVNVGLDGYASVLFPESPEDDGFMRGGRTYRLPSFFPGFVTNFRPANFRRLYNATAAYDDVYDRYAGYVFIIASRDPMHFELTEALGLWEAYRLAVHERQLDPYSVVHWFAERFVPHSRDYSVQYARYAAFRGGFGSGGSLAYCSLYASTLGYLPRALYAVGGTWVPAYGFGHYGLGSRCGGGYGYGYALSSRRPIARPIVRPPVTNPTPGTPQPGARPPRDEEDPRTPPGKDGGRRKSRPRDRAAEGEMVIDVTRESRWQTRRSDREAARGEGAYRRPSSWSRSEGAASRGDRAAADRSDRRDRSDRGSSRGASETGSRSRAESVRRGEGRRSEPRREAPAQAQPRSEPRSQPAPQSAPASRGEDRARPAPRP